MSQLKHNFSAVVDLVSAIQSYSVHHLHYAPNIAASGNALCFLKIFVRERLNFCSDEYLEVCVASGNFSHFPVSNSSHLPTP